jgi:citrate lyase gamma subunit
MDVLDQKTVTVGNKGKDVRSDCQVTMELAESGGIQLTIDSRVKALYGVAIRKLAEEILSFFGDDEHFKIFGR